MTIEPRNFELASKHLEMLGHSGPVGLAVDDSKVSPTWRLVENKSGTGMVLIGAIGGPVEVLDLDAAKKIINEHSVKQATKVYSHKCLDFSLLTCL